MRGWSKDSIPEGVCILCIDPYGAYHVDLMHTYKKGCLEYEAIMEMLKDLDL